MRTYCQLDSLSTSLPGKNWPPFRRRYFQMQFLERRVLVFGFNLLMFVPKRPIGNTSALIQVKAWRRTGDRPLPEPMLVQFNNAYMRH